LPGFPADLTEACELRSRLCRDPAALARAGSGIGPGHGKFCRNQRPEQQDCCLAAVHQDEIVAMGRYRAFMQSDRLRP
jgi:hypothetical protein